MYADDKFSVMKKYVQGREKGENFFYFLFEEQVSE